MIFSNKGHQALTTQEFEPKKIDTPNLTPTYPRKVTFPSLGLGITATASAYACILMEL